MVSTCSRGRHNVARDARTTTYCYELSAMQPPISLEQIAAQMEALGFNMASEPRTEAFLRTSAALKPAGQFWS